MKKFLRYIPVVVFVALALAGGVFVCTQTQYTIKTGSMSANTLGTPPIPVGARVFVDRNAHYRKGDVITFHSEHGIVTHRFIGRGPHGEILTKGDANPTADVWTKPITSKDVIGRVAWSQPNYGWTVVLLVATVFMASLFLLWCVSSTPEKRVHPKVAPAARPA